MELRYTVEFKRFNGQVVARVQGQRAVALENLTVHEVTVQVAEAEKLLSKLTGLMVQIEQVG